ncbi:hypothetical protein [uncultured Nitrospira sp.]|uniref:hypothetical protein n=1 Tax=uncultured Nitrospira sp. TaxID=157176 RepID=UPI00314045C7
MRNSCTISVWLVLLLVLTSLSIQGAHAKDPSPTSREYKLMLKPEIFNGTDPLPAIQTLWNMSFQPILDTTLDLHSDGKPRYHGSFHLDKERIVRFWDTPAPRPCLLKRHGYIFRERVRIEEGNKKTREVTLKFRSADQYLAATKEMIAKNDKAETKFEEDIGQVIVQVFDEFGVLHRYTDSNPSFKSVYSHSTTHPFGENKTPNTIKDVLNLYPGLSDGLKEESAKVNKDETIVPVSDMEVYEKVYTGPIMDLGKLDATFSLTLWYLKNDQAATHPMIAEISFKYELPNGENTFPRKVAKRAKDVFDTMQTLPAIDPTSSTKTAAVYDHANFCGS